MLEQTEGYTDYQIVQKADTIKEVSEFIVEVVDETVADNRGNTEYLRNTEVSVTVATAWLMTAVVAEELFGE